MQALRAGARCAGSLLTRDQDIPQHIIDTQAITGGLHKLQHPSPF